MQYILIVYSAVIVIEPICATSLIGCSFDSIAIFVVFVMHAQCHRLFASLPCIE